VTKNKAAVFLFVQSGGALYIKQINSKYGY